LRAAGCPAVDGSGEETGWMPERLQANLRGVDGMQSGKALDQLSAQHVADLGSAGQIRRQNVADNHPRAVLDYLERRAEHARFIAKEYCSRR
jgi:hypothetical protein